SVRKVIVRPVPENSNMTGPVVGRTSLAGPEALTLIDAPASVASSTTKAPVIFSFEVPSESTVSWKNSLLTGKVTWTIVLPHEESNGAAGNGCHFGPRPSANAVEHPSMRAQQMRVLIGCCISSSWKESATDGLYGLT